MSTKASNHARIEGNERAAWLGIVVLAVVTLLCVGSAEAQNCSRTVLHGENTGLLAGATWVDGLDALVMLEVYGGQRVQHQLSSSGRLGSADNALPSETFMLERAGAGFLALVGDFNKEYEVQLLDRDLVPKATLRPGSARSRSGAVYEIKSLFDQELVGETLISFSAATDQKGEWVYSLFASPIARPDRSRMILEYEPDYFLLGHSMIAGDGPIAYFLAMRSADYPVLYRFDTRKSTPPEVVDGLPYEELLPDLAMLDRDPVELAGIFREIEAFDGVPVGLYSDNGFLYTLTRSPAVGGGTRWALTKLEPVAVETSGEWKVEVRGEMTLPTRSANLSLSRASDHWVVLEQGSVAFDGQRPSQPLTGMIRIPAQWIDEPGSSPLTGSKAIPVDTCR